MFKYPSTGPTGQKPREIPELVIQKHTNTLYSRTRMLKPKNKKYFTGSIWKGNIIEEVSSLERSAFRRRFLCQDTRCLCSFSLPLPRDQFNSRKNTTHLGDRWIYGIYGIGGAVSCVSCGLLMKNPHHFEVSQSNTEAMAAMDATRGNSVYT